MGRQDILLIVGIGRSGTTLVAEQLNQHFALGIGSETGILGMRGISAAARHGLSHDDLRQRSWHLQHEDGLEEVDLRGAKNRFDVLERVLDHRNPGQDLPLADKTPHHWPHIDEALDRWGDRLKVIFCFRDPRDTFRSHLAMPWSPLTEGGMIMLYRETTALAKKWLRKHPDQIRIHHHERFVEDPQGHLQAYGEWLGLQPKQGEVGATFADAEEDWKGDARRPPDPALLYKWKQRLFPYDHRLSWSLRKELDYHGYEQLPETPRLRQRFGMTVANVCDRGAYAMRRRMVFSDPWN